MITTLFTDPLAFIAGMIAIVIAIGVHEFAHAYTADYLGDPTPRLQGRVTLNPVKHIDPLGILLIALFGFGWGKPVEFDPYNLQNPRKDSAIISIAGPISNFILATLASLLLRGMFAFDNELLISIGYFFLFPFISFNLVLGLFNLIPIHPLDGFKIVGGILPEAKAHEWYELQRYGIIFLILLIIPLTGNQSMLETILRPILSFLYPFFLPMPGAGVL